MALRGVYYLPFNLDDPVVILQLSSLWFIWKCENDNEDDMNKNGLLWQEDDYVKMNICAQINGLKMQ